MTVIRWVTESRLKRADCCTRWEGDGYKEVVLGEDYEALAAELADIARDLHDVEGKNMVLCGRIRALSTALRLVNDRHGPILEASVHDAVLACLGLEVHPNGTGYGYVAETPASTLCAICDQIKELHPSTHEWTPKETSPEQASYLKTRDCEHEWLPTGAYIAERCSKCSAGRAVETKGEGT